MDTSTPSKTSIRRESPNAGSVKVSPERLVQVRSNGTGETGKSHVTFGKTIAVRSIFLPFEWADEITMFTIRFEQPVIESVIPDT